MVIIKKEQQNKRYIIIFNSGKNISFYKNLSRKKNPSISSFIVVFNSKNKVLCVLK